MQLSLNSIFNSFKDFETLKNVYQKEKFIQLSIVQSDKYLSDHKYYNTLVYRRIHFGCKYGKKIHTSQATKRNSSSYKQNCPFKMVLKAVKGKLVVKQLVETHSAHPISEKDFKHLPEQRRLTPEETEEAVKFLRLKGNNKKELQKFMIEKTNKVVLLTDINRIANKIKSNPCSTDDRTDLKHFIKELCAIQSSIVEVTMNGSEELLGIYFQEKRMVETFNSYPELLVVDATYHLPEYGIPVLLLLIADGNGDSEVCCVWFLQSGSTEAMESMCKAFKKYNPKWSSTDLLVWNGVKENNYLEAIKLNFLNLRICDNIYQVLRTFNREITVKSCSISEDQRSFILNLLTKMVWASSLNAYHTVYDCFKSIQAPKVHDYFEKSWRSITTDWVLLEKKEFFRFMNKEMSKCENFTHKLKAVIAKHTRLEPFFPELMSSFDDNDRVYVDNEQLDDCLISEKANVNPSTDKIINDGDSFIKNEMRTTLTSFAYEIASAEFGAHTRIALTDNLGGTGKSNDEEEGEVENTVDDCQCAFRTAFKLPCRHIFAYRKLTHAQPVFHQNLCAKRWLRPYLKSLSQTQLTASRSFEMSEEDKRAKIDKLLTKLNDAISAQPLDRFSHYVEQWEKLIRFITAGQLIDISSKGESLANEIRGLPKSVSTVLLHELQNNNNSLSVVLSKVKFPAKLVECQTLIDSDSEPKKKKLKNQDF